MKIVFMGTPEFSLDSLRVCCEYHELIGVFTQPDRPKGRGKKLQSPAVKILAESLGYEVYQPEKIKVDEWEDFLEKLKPDVIVVVAYGQILSQRILDIPRLGCINVHASLLPFYRGASPYQWAIVNGEKRTGVTTMLMDEGLDTGDMLFKKEISIPEEMTAGELHDELAKLGAEVLKETLDAIENQNVKPIKQDDSKASYAPLLTKKMACLSWDEKAETLRNKVRGLNPWPVAFTSYQGEILKIFKMTDPRVYEHDFLPGTVLEITSQEILVATSDGSVSLKEIQMGSGKRMDVGAFLRGRKIEKGVILGQ